MRKDVRINGRFITFEGEIVATLHLIPPGSYEHEKQSDFVRWLGANASPFRKEAKKCKSNPSMQRRSKLGLSV